MSQTFATLKKRVMGHLGRQGLGLSMEEVEQAINDAVDELRLEQPYDLAPNESVTLVDDTYEYSIATLSFGLIHRITMSDSDGKYPVENIIPQYKYTVFGVTPTLKFDEFCWGPVAGRTLRIEGQGYQPNLSADTDICYIYTPAVVYLAAASLVGNIGNINRERLLMQKAEVARNNSPFYAHPNCMVIATSGVGTYVTVNQGATSVADNGTIAHGLSTTPTGVVVTTTVANEYAAVSAIGATTFTVQLTKHDGSAGTTQTVYWRAWV